MDPSAVRFPPSVDQEEDEWDTDGFVIPSLGIADSDQSIPYAPNIESSNSPAKAKMEEENIYLGPHGAPPSQSKQQELNSSSRKQRLKQKLKEADKRISGTGRENKLDNLRELVGGGGKESFGMAKGSPKDWLDPHCHEAQFERREKLRRSCILLTIILPLDFLVILEGLVAQNIYTDVCVNHMLTMVVVWE